jgi:hypothetical protein
MEISKTDLAEKFLRTYTEPFSVQEMKKVLNSIGISASYEDAESFIWSSSSVFRLSEQEYITYAGAFTGEIFSIMPTPAEVAQGVLVPGDRCMPFVESDRVSATLQFYLNGKLVPEKVGVFDSDDAIDMFILFGEEYAPQYIASDPANADLDMVEREYELPNTVRLTGIDLDYLSKNCAYKKGDRILCCVSNWDEGILNIMVLHSDETKFDKGEIGEKRLEWYSLLEKFFLDDLEINGPEDCIEDQVRNVIFANRKELCVPYCGSLEEFFFRYTKKIGFQHYGVETRIWKKGEDVPAFGHWNICTRINGIFQSAMSFADFLIGNVSECVYNQLIMNFLYTKGDDLTKYVTDFICHGNFVPNSHQTAEIALKLKDRYNSLRKGYNWFADQALGPVRKRALELYGEVFPLMCKIDFLGDEVYAFPSQELVILSQLHSHALRIVDTIDSDPSAEKITESLLLSLEGMEWNFEDIRGVLEDELAKVSRSRFKVIRGNFVKK